MWPRKPASRLVSFEFTANALENIKALAADPDTRPVAVAALRLAKQLGENPYLGEPLREKANLKPLAAADCRKLKFDRAERKITATPRYRYRLVYRIEPHDGSPEQLVILALGVKPGVYRDATRQAAVRLKQGARGRRARPR